jgi:hypothetical protein
MNTPESSQANLSQDLLPGLESRAKKVLNDVEALLERGAVEDETDKKMIGEAMEIINNPEKNLQEIMTNTTNVGIVLSGYEMQGMDPPAEIYALHCHLLALQCVGEIEFVEAALEHGSYDASRVDYAMAGILDWGTALSKGWAKDNTYLAAGNQLQGRLAIEKIKILGSKKALDVIKSPAE